MKRVLLSILILSPIIGSAQIKLEGRYCQSIPEAEYTCIDFKENGEFYYQKGGCLGLEAYGSGTFKLRGKTLVLRFDYAEQPHRNEVIITELKSSSLDSIRLEFIVKDEAGELLPVWILKEEDTKASRNSIDKNIVTISRNDKKYNYRKVLRNTMDNNAVTVFRNDKNHNYRIDFIGYGSSQLTLNHSSSKKVEIIMFPVSPQVISEKNMKWKFIEINEDELKKGKSAWSNFRKVTE